MKFKSEDLTRASIIAGIYYALTIIFSMISYGPIQFRISEVLNLLAFYNPGFAPGIVLGVFLSNLSSPLGGYDLLFGTFHTAVSLYFMTQTKSKLIASLWPTFFSFIIGLELFLLYGGGVKGFLSLTVSVMISEFIVCSIVSLPLYSAIEKNENFRRIIK